MSAPTRHYCLGRATCVTCSRPKDRPFRRRAAAVCPCITCAANRLHAAQAKPGNSTGVAAARADYSDAQFRNAPHRA